MGLRDRGLYKDQCCFFVTTTCRNHFHLLDKGDNYQIISKSINFVCNKYKADILSYALMPNHLHLILYFREKNHLSALMRDFKKFTATRIRKEIERVDPDLLEELRIPEEGRVFQVWQERFDDVWLEDRSLVESKMDYIHLNPLQEHWSLVDTPERYLHSSASYYETGNHVGLVAITHYVDYF